MARKKARTINPTPAGQKGVKTPFAQTECKLKIPSGHPGQKIPETKEEKSFFINLESGNATYIEVFEALQKVKGTNWITRRWDLLLTIEKTAQKLEAPVAFDLLGRNIVAAWPGSPPSCLACQSARHQAKKCPLRKSKAGDVFDPEHKSMSHPGNAETTKSGPDSSPVPQTQPKTSGSAKSGDADVQQKSSPGSTSKSGQETKSGVYASIHNPLSQKTAAPG